VQLVWPQVPWNGCERAQGRCRRTCMRVTIEVEQAGHHPCCRQRFGYHPSEQYARLDTMILISPCPMFLARVSTLQKRRSDCFNIGSDFRNPGTFNLQVRASAVRPKTARASEEIMSLLLTRRVHHSLILLRSWTHCGRPKPSGCYTKRNNAVGRIWRLDSAFGSRRNRVETSVHKCSDDGTTTHMRWNFTVPWRPTRKW
jgi:hypothetical protein